MKATEAEHDEDDVEGVIDEAIKRLNDLRQASSASRRPPAAAAKRQPRDRQSHGTGLKEVPLCTTCQGKHRGACPNKYLKTIAPTWEPSQT